MSLEIPREVAEAAGVPDDLDSTVVGPYLLPSPKRRRLAARPYVGGAVVAAVGAVAGLPVGMWAVAGGLAAVAVYHWISAWELEVRDDQALETANREVSFAVGHASAQVGFEGWRARPIWNVLVFSADDPPSQRGLVRVDGVSGEVVGSYTEQVPAS
ncbi:MAG: hypothetical protein OEM22_04820 [Acidimicrobiia bacterium]|nr:hypothetical protein [Acidimicrobiia bacterium]